MKNRIVIAVLSWSMMMLTACKKDDPQPPYTIPNQGPDVTIEKITNTNQLIEGSNDTVFFKVKLSRPFQNVHQATMARVLIYYGDTTAINGADLFVFDQTGQQYPEYDFYAENYNQGWSKFLRFYSVNFYPGDQERIVGIKPKENSIYEKDKVYTFNVFRVDYPLIFGSYVDYYDGKNIQVSYNYIDNDLMPVLGFDHGITTSIQVQETSGNGQSARIKLTNRSGFSIPVNYSVSGSAINGTDYIIKSPNSLLIKPGEYYYDFNFDVVNDNITEGTESFTIKLVSADNALLGSPTNNSIFLRDSIQVFINE